MKNKSEKATPVLAIIREIKTDSIGKQKEIISEYCVSNDMRVSAWELLKKDLHDNSERLEKIISKCHKLNISDIVVAEDIIVTTDISCFYWFKMNLNIHKIQLHLAVDESSQYEEYSELYRCLKLWKTSSIV